MIRLSRGAEPAAIIGEPRPEKRARAEDRAAGVERMRADLVHIRGQLYGMGAKPAWFVERYGCWPQDALQLLEELGARKGRCGEWKL